MSQEYSPLKGSVKPGGRPRTPDAPNQFARPNFLIVGSGHTSEHAQRLTTMLDNDSGYGGSIADSSSSAKSWDLATVEDYPASPQTADRYSNNADGLCISSHSLLDYS